MWNDHFPVKLDMQTLRQQLTDSHLSQLLLISQEGPEILSRNELFDIVYIWYKSGDRRIQLPDRTALQQIVTPSNK